MRTRHDDVHAYRASTLYIRTKFMLVHVHDVCSVCIRETSVHDNRCALPFESSSRTVARGSRTLCKFFVDFLSRAEPKFEYIVHIRHALFSSRHGSSSLMMMTRVVLFVLSRTRRCLDGEKIKTVLLVKYIIDIIMHRRRVV